MYRESTALRGRGVFRTGKPHQIKRPGPAATSPRSPSSRRDRRRMIHATLYRLSILVHVSCRRLASMPWDDVAEIVASIPLGENNRRGRAHREAEKLLRLQGQ